MVHSHNHTTWVPKVRQPGDQGQPGFCRDVNDSKLAYVRRKTQFKKVGLDGVRL